MYIQPNFKKSWVSLPYEKIVRVIKLNPTYNLPVYSQASTFSISGKNCLRVPSTHPLSVAG